MDNIMKGVQRQKNRTRVLGGIEIISGLVAAGFTVASLSSPEVREAAPLVYTFSGLALTDGIADIVSGRDFYLIQKACEVVENFRYNRRIKKESKYSNSNQ